MFSTHQPSLSLLSHCFFLSLLITELIAHCIPTTVPCFQSDLGRFSFSNQLLWRKCWVPLKIARKGSWGCILFMSGVALKIHSINLVLYIHLQLVHTLSVSLNKIGDLRYYDGDLQSARSYYSRSLDFRRNAVKEHSAAASQIISKLSLMIKHKS